MDIDNAAGSRMDCAQLAAALLLAADDELGPDELPLMVKHLAGCAACRTQRALFHRTDRRLLACGEVLDAMGRLSAPQHQTRIPWLRRVRGWQWATVALAGLSFVAMTVWIIAAPWRADRGDSAKAKSGSRSFSSAELSAGSTEVIRVELALSPVGNPFLDGSQSESVVLADVDVGPDGLPQAVRLAN